jgi:hypothetical protein
MKLLSILIGLVLFTGCQNLNLKKTPREPAARLNVNELVFNIDEPNYTEIRDREFLLVDFQSLRSKKVSFKKFKLGNVLADSSLPNWREQLAGFSKEVFTESFGKTLFFEFENYSVRIKKEDFDNLDKALNLIENESSQDLAFRRYKQALLIDAFNTYFQSPYEFGASGVAIVGQHFKRSKPYTIAAGGIDQEPKSPSAFWQKVDIQSEFQRILKQEEDFRNQVLRSSCEYDSPKRGYGIHLNFKVKCGSKKFKLKLGEENAGPMNSKVYRMLGYYVPTLFYASQVAVNWDPKIFTEMNQSRSVKLKILGMGNEVKVKIRYRDHVLGAKMKSGEMIEVDEFLRKLAPSCDLANQACLTQEGKMDPQFSQEIAQIIFKDVGMQEEPKVSEFGSWSFDQMDLPYRLELKSLLLVGAFTGNHDLRRDNNELIFDHAENRIKFALSDVGSGYRPPKAYAGGSIKEMPYDVIIPAKQSSMSQGEAELGESNASDAVLEVSGYVSNAVHQSFRNLKFEEAKWMGRRIMSLPEEIIRKSFELSGYSADYVELGTEKLVSRQQNIGEMLGIINEFPTLKERKIVRKAIPKS